MTALLLICGVWVMTLTLWVILKLRQPKLMYPAPPQVSAADRREAA
jgi:hypothetical protein